MNNNLKNALIGLGIAAASGAAIMFFLNDNVQEATKASYNRMRAKYFVRNYLNGSERALKAIDHMDNEEINDLLETADRMSDLKHQFTDYGDQFKDTAVDIKDNIVDYAKNLVN
ncbi:MAG: hypothetical protein Q4F26_04030 [Atopococcus tabaci]|uniref:YtxH domain-containing protein n=1 Tax=Atopococcus tabaci TaxID=269774 RepID=A0AA43UCK6_9LACT|nr:hypothetical protein [Atopococcus tabaci]